MATRRTKKTREYTIRDREGLVRAIEHYLRECYREAKPVREKELARSLDRTPEHLSWLATRVLGGPLHRFLRRRQVEYAARLLRRTPLSIEEIAARSGFGTRSTMHRWFVDAYGIGPQAFRDRC
ncbi:MAG TPA: AraC family transcriptional regulator [Thermoanaerobaculia bacterium]|nr:AraC family transcriptional regulator [Thermoanaerobaculia bacterium]